MKCNVGCVLFTCSLLFSCSASLTVPEEQAALEKGAMITDASFQALSGKLQQAMEKGGPSHAVEFCSLNALSIVDSLSELHGAKIRRTSDRIRNVNDLPDQDEARVLQNMLGEWKLTDNSATLSHRVELVDDSVAYYRPIFINSPACLKCHGMSGSTLDSAAQTAIDVRYQNDLATGYRPNDLRGMWSVRWKHVELQQ